MPDAEQKPRSLRGFFTLAEAAGLAPIFRPGIAACRT